MTHSCPTRRSSDLWFHSEGCPMRAILRLFATLALPVAAAAPIAIPLREGLTLVSTVSRPAGNINTELKITAINARTVKLSFTGKSRGGSPLNSQRSVRVQDLKSARAIRPNFVNGASEFFENSTAFGTSSLVLGELRSEEHT